LNWSIETSTIPCPQNIQHILERSTLLCRQRRGFIWGKVNSMAVSQWCLTCTNLSQNNQLGTWLTDHLPHKHTSQRALGSYPHSSASSSVLHSLGALNVGPAGEQESKVWSFSVCLLKQQNKYVISSPWLPQQIIMSWVA
jgi:hypothetical protein